MNTRSICQSLSLFALIVMIWHEKALCQSSCPDPNSYTISCISGNCNSSDEGCSYNIRFTSSFTGNNKYAFITIRYEGTIIHTECVGPLSGGTTSYSVTVNNIDCNVTTSQLGGNWTAYTHSHRNNPCTGNICKQGYCSAGTCATGILPTELGLFEAKQVEKGVMVLWTTLSESNNDHFEIQRSRNGIDWEIIGLEKGAEFSDESKTYDFLDTRPHQGLNYYRLVQRDLDGSTSFSHMVLLEYYVKEHEIIVDMARRAMQIRTDNPDLLELMIIDQRGQKLLQRKLKPGDYINLQHLPAGIYTAMMKQAAGGIDTHRFILP